MAKLSQPHTLLGPLRARPNFLMPGDGVGMVRDRVMVKLTTSAPESPFAKGRAMSGYHGANRLVSVVKISTPPRRENGCPSASKREPLKIKDTPTPRYPFFLCAACGGRRDPVLRKNKDLLRPLRTGNS